MQKSPPISIQIPQFHRPTTTNPVANKTDFKNLWAWEQGWFVEEIILVVKIFY